MWLLLKTTCSLCTYKRLIGGTANKVIFIVRWFHFSENTLMNIVYIGHCIQFGVWIVFLVRAGKSLRKCKHVWWIQSHFKPKFDSLEYCWNRMVKKLLEQSWNHYTWVMSADVQYKKFGIWLEFSGTTFADIKLNPPSLDKNDSINSHANTPPQKVIIPLYGLSHICSQRELYSISIFAAVPPLVN